MIAIPKKTFLLRQEELEGGKKKDVIAHKGVKIEISDKEAIKFWGYFDHDDAAKKKLMQIHRNQKVLRTV